MKKVDIFNLLFKIILLILEILIIVWEIQILFGGSPTVEELLIGIVLLLGGLTFSHNRELAIIKNDMRHNFSNIRHSFNNIKEDMNLIKNKLKIK